MSKKKSFDGFNLKQPLLSFSKPIFWKSFLLDFSFIALILLLCGFFYFLVNFVSIPVVGDLALANVLKQADDPEFEDFFLVIAPNVFSVLWKLILISLIFYLLVVALISWLYDFNWSVVKNEKFNFSFFKKLFLINLAWFTFWFIILILTLYLFNPVIFIILITVFIILDFALRSVTSVKFGFKQTFKSFFQYVKTKPVNLFKFILVNVLLCIFFMIIIGLASKINLNFASVLVLFLFLVQLGIARNLMINLVNKKRVC